MHVKHIHVKLVSMITLSFKSWEDLFMKRHIPNIITCCNLVCGCIATCAAFQHHFYLALLFILLGAVFDFFDGMTARVLGVSGRLGVELDSLADVVTFGVAPSAVLFTLFHFVHYPMFMYNHFWFALVPNFAFLVAAFSALRLAKFNIDERQHTTFIGLPTPANALFWAAFVAGCEDYLRSPMMNIIFLFAFIVLSCWLLVCEVPMFSLKFQSYAWADNKVKYVFLALCGVILIGSLIAGIGMGSVWLRLARGLAGCIGLYIVMGLFTGLRRND